MIFKIHIVRVGYTGGSTRFFLEIHKAGNIAILVLLKFEYELEIVISDTRLSSVKSCFKFILDFIWLPATSNLFNFGVTQKY